ncbi:ABC transporter permease subunit [Pseudooceanicola sp. GBMRC 2024]|uniref:ABC transporter permease subunit n=1 Tax=Pseudooceanicola albus TaxID=2692189 RepID=A0A6L7G2U8_9RHOB|nr:ABC transporter permease [Pseudooceanicola albus]MXN17838.1 ABC transporter permease subunit [Pseudooceanicola albus]
MPGLSSPLLRALVSRLGAGAVTLLIVSVLIFAAVAALPGDYARASLGRSATPETVAALRTKLGLDAPAPLRYVKWMDSALHGDLGLSLSSGAGQPRPVTAIIAPRLKNTLRLAGLTALFAVPLALIGGLLAAMFRNSWIDRGLNLLSLGSISFPEFFTAYVLMLLFAVKLPIFYSTARITPDMGWSDMLARLALPMITLSFGIIAHMMRMTRAALITVLGRPYVEMARLKGVSPLRVMLTHALPNALAPIATVIAFNLAYLVVGVVVVEVVFVYPGIGQTMIDAVRSRDIPVVQGCALIFAATYILLNLAADLVGILSNPRLSHSR